MLGLLEETAETRKVRTRQRFRAAVMRGLARVELHFDQLLWGLRRRYGRLGPLQIVTYRGFGTPAHAVVRGRVLEASVLERSLPDDSALTSFRRMLRRFNSRELPEATVRVALGVRQVSGTTDHEGYFDLALAGVDSSDAAGWQTAEVEVVDAPVRGLAKVKASAELLIPNQAAEFAIISDIDDTVLRTYVTQTLKMIWLTLSGSAFTRSAFEGTSELYTALVAGASGQANNPVFYVSKSPWNLYDFLVDFLDHHGLPRGPLLLRDIGLHEAPPVDHKSAAVRQLLETYPELPFVLIGDSGERDPEIYLETAARYPGRIRAIYIRDLGSKRGSERAERARGLCERAAARGTAMLWMSQASDALAHARTHGVLRAAPQS